MNLVFSEIFCKFQFPKFIPAVIKHGERVTELASRRTGMSWYLYDKQVWKDIEAGDVPWGKLHYEYLVLAPTSKESTTVQNVRAKSQFQNNGGSYISKRKFMGILFCISQIR